MNAARAESLLSARFPARRAAITGGASGLGLAAARILAAGGWKIALLDLDTARLDAAGAELRAAGAAVVTTHPVDTTNEEDVRAAVAEFARRHDGLDFALNAAGVAAAGSFMDTPSADWDWVMRINVLGVANSCRAEIGHMADAGGGLIVNVASAAGFVSGADMSAYSASKAAVISLSETLAQELERHHIQVCVAMPGFFRTRLMDQARAPAEALELARRIMRASNLEADQVAAEILLRAARGDAYIVLPREYRLLWRFKRLAPRSFQRFMIWFRRRKEAQAAAQARNRADR